MKNTFTPRKIIRLKERDYSRQGYYHTTICIYNKQEDFGVIENNCMKLNEYGNIAQNAWLDLPNHHKNIKLDESIIMPNHVHGIINLPNIVGPGLRRRAGSKPALKHTHASINNNGNGYNGKMINHKRERAGLEPAPTKHGLSEIVRQFKTFSAKLNLARSRHIVLTIWRSSDLGY